MHDKLLLIEGFTQTIQVEVKLSNCRLFLEHFEDTIDIDRTVNNGTRQLALYSLVYTPTFTFYADGNKMPWSANRQTDRAGN